MDRSELAARAERWGIVHGYHDISGRWQEASDDTLERALALVGADDAEHPAEPPVRCVWSGKMERTGPGTVVTEDGRELDIAERLPADVPLGYHRFVDPAGRDTMLVVSPGRCFLPPDLRVWGWALQLHSLRSRRSWGMGDLADLREFARWSKGTGAGMTMLNPLHAPNPGPDPQPSPYFPSSRVWRNPLYIAISEVPGAEGVDLSDLERAALRLNEDRVLRRPEVARAKYSALRRLWTARSPDAGFAGYRASKGRTLGDYAAYMAIAEVHGSDWRSWPTSLRRPDGTSVEEFARERADSVEFHAWVQYLIDCQLASVAAETALIHDLAVGVDPGGADAWLYGDAFAQGVGSGAPPDEFNRAGQDWGVLPFQPRALQAAEYRPYIDMLRACLSPGGGVRVDHVMGLWRTFWVLQGGSPTDGVYVRYPAGDLLDILALESQRAGAFVIGEDLGTVEPHVRSEMRRRDMLGYRVLWFEPAPPAEYEPRSLAAVTNHDLPTVAGLWTGHDVAVQRQLGMAVDEGAEDALRARVRSLLDLDGSAEPRAVTERLYEALATAPCSLLAATLEDALGETVRPNYPGTTAVTNWSRALPKTLEEIVADADVGRLAVLLSGRRP